MKKETKAQNIARWNRIATELLIGQKVKRVCYLSDDEIEHMGWDARSVGIEFESGLVVWISQDDEGNGPGSLFTSDDKVPVLPVLWWGADE